MGDKNAQLIITVLVRIGQSANFLGLAGSSQALIKPKPKFKFPAFENAKDHINVNLTSQLQTKGMDLKEFNKSVDHFITKEAANKMK